MASRTPKQWFLLSCILILISLLVAEGAAHVILAWMGPPPAPLDLDWAGTATTERKRKLRETVYVPDIDCFFRLAANVDLEKTATARIFDLQTNSLGMRGPEIEIEKPAGVLRVLCIGDSCTFGSGAGGRMTYPVQLQEQLEATLGAGKVQVINAGVPGYTSYQAVAYLESRGLALDPDAVILIAGYNDSGPATVGRKGPHETTATLSDLEYSKLGSRAEPALAVLRLAKRLGGSAAQEADAQVAGKTTPAVQAPAEKSDKLRVSVEEYAANIERMLEICTEHDILPVLGVWPIRAQSIPTFEDDRDKLAVLPPYQAAIMEFATRTSVAVVDLRPVLAGKNLLYADRVHLTGKGYGLVSSSLAPALADLQLR